MTAAYLQSRIDFLLDAQNADGGWGYFPGKASWLEPTAYAMLALHRVPAGSAAVERAWGLIRGWQLEDGGWRPAAQIQSATWVTALAVTLCCIRQSYDDRFRRGLKWLLKISGAESSLPMRAASYLHLLATDVNVTHKAWPWRPGNASWIEPTAHALIALKKIPDRFRTRELANRIEEAENMIFSRRGHDGGWNSGNPNVLKIDLPSYPETTALAMLGLQGRRSGQLVQPARRFLAESKSSLANAWLEIALRCYRAQTPDLEKQRGSPDILLAALEALGHSEGNYRLLQVAPGSSAAA